MKEVVDYLGSYFDFPLLNLPKIEAPEIEEIDTDFLRAAAEVHRYWDIRPGPMPDVLEKLESNGILVSRIHVGAGKLDAFSQWSDRFNLPFIVLSRDKASAVRQRFDALHELAHVVLPQDSHPRKKTLRIQFGNRVTGKSIAEICHNASHSSGSEGGILTMDPSTLSIAL